LRMQFKLSSVCSFKNYLSPFLSSKALSPHAAQ